MSETSKPHEDGHTTEAPNPETGVGIGQGEASTFEPEEDVESLPEDPAR